MHDKMTDFTSTPNNVDAARQNSSEVPTMAPSAVPSSANTENMAISDAKDANDQNNFSQRKRKGDFSPARGGRRQGGRGGAHDNKRNKKGDMGRGEYFSSQLDRRKRNEEANEKRQRQGPVPGQGIQFSKEEIAAEERRPKRKVAVLIGYAGTGYKGMQISGTERTIEGDLFQAFIKAGAISKANAEDPKKSSLVRCARTDKGVHAAGNMVSLKLIVEDEDIVEKINAELCPQIRVWGIERVISSFSCYQACDSRWYEYLIPSYAFLPPHPSSWLAKQLEKLADEANDRSRYESRQEEAKDFWADVEENEIRTILNSLDEDLRWEVVKALQGEEEASAKAVKPEAESKPRTTAQDGPGQSETTASDQIPVEGQNSSDADAKPEASSGDPEDPEASSATSDRTLRLKAATRKLRNAYMEAKRRYRIPPVRVARIQSALDKYVGTKNYHNYTIQKTFKDPSAMRHIKSFVVNKTPILIGDGPDESKTEWLSLKVHGQSFMMHQIRKMVGMVTLMVRSGGDLSTMDDSFTESRYSIPKVPGLGLLLERPVFDSYNKLQATKYDKQPLVFDKYEKELEAFKQKEIYERIFREEEQTNEFARFFNHVDNFKEPWFLYVTSMGLAAAKGSGGRASLAEIEGSDDEEGQGDS